MPVRSGGALVPCLVAVVLAIALTPGTAAAAQRPAVYVDPAGVGGACDDARDADAASDSATPVCSLSRGWAVAPDGSDIVLRDGSHGAPTLSGKAGRTAGVRIVAAPGERPQLGTTSLADTSHVRLEGLELGSVALRPGVSHVAVVGNTMSGGLHIDEGDHDVLFEGNDVTAPRSNGVLLSTSSTQPKIARVVVRGNRFHDIGIVGVNARNFEDVLVEDNEFTGVHSWNGTVHPDVIRTFAGGSGLIVRRNFIHDNTAQGVFIKDGFVSDVTIENNVIVRTAGNFYGINIYNASDVRIRNNTIMDNGGSVIFQGTATNVEFVNNITPNVLVTGSVTWTREDYNLILGNTGTGPNTIRSAPVFVDREGGDYRLAAGSPGIDAALSTAVPEKDLRRLARLDDPATPNTGGGFVDYYDIGAYEFGAPTPGPGPVDPDGPLEPPSPPAPQSPPAPPSPLAPPSPPAPVIPAPVKPVAPAPPWLPARPGAGGHPGHRASTPPPKRVAKASRTPKQVRPRVRGKAKSLTTCAKTKKARRSKARTARKRAVAAAARKTSCKAAPRKKAKRRPTSRPKAAARR